MRTTRRRTRGPVGGAIILIGLGILLFVKSIPFWPWILVVIALASLPDGIARSNPVAGLLPALWLIALAVLIATGTLWPGVLFLIGIPILISAAIRGGRR
jgi:hypothetical protein